LADERRERIFKAVKTSLGSHIDDKDYQAIKDMAELGLQVEESKEQLETYIENTLIEECPNMVALIGSLLTARLLAAAGSLENLSRVPSSTIQLYGAEKALFRHLRKHVDPPKHGLIFQSPLIHQAPKWQRGKIARLLAGKISLAAKIDYFSKEDRSSELINDLNTRLEEIRTKYKKPPKRKPRPEKDKRKGKGKRRSKRRSKRKEH
jgi:nucleolar protein 56